MKKIDDICNELLVLNSCHKDMHLRLDNARGASIDKLSEVELLARIKKAAVRMIHMSVHRKTFHSMRQEEGENFNQWVTCLHQKMNMCEYRIPCGAAGCVYETNYGNVLVEEAMIANMYDQDDQDHI